MTRMLSLPGWLMAVLLLVGCAATERSVAIDEPLVNTYWKLTHLGDAPVTPVEQRREAHLVLHVEDQRVAGSTGCNRLTGRYRLEGNRLGFDRLASTRMACPAGMQTEQAFLDALGRVTGWAVEGGQLVLTDAEGQVLARFRAVSLT